MLRDRRELLMFGALTAAGAAVPSGLRAQGFPSRALTLVVPFAPVLIGRAAPGRWPAARRTATRCCSQAPA
jgi:hypothetical protein